MGCFMVNGLLISKNAKTGLSLNVNQCSPTKFCREHCYRMFRTWDIIKSRGYASTSTPNTGPITWKTQQNAYVRNEHTLYELANRNLLDETAAIVAQRLLTSRNVLRGNGSGDLFPELVDFYAVLASKCIKVYLFSRRPKMIDQLRKVCRTLEVTAGSMPYVIGSMDPTTKLADAFELARATEMINGHAALAYATAATGQKGCIEVDSHPLRQHIKVVFGYHSGNVKTVLGHELECPATAGKDVKCDACRICYGPGR